jgi:radical SAM superfamily enzyme YgiQ (UPF0313 family)
MKILLVIPTSNYPRNNPSFLSNTDFPVGFAYIAASLKQAGHRVYGLNPNNDTRFESAQELLKNRLIQAIAETNPHMIGLGGLSSDIHFINDAITIIRAIRPHIQIVCGGGIITNDAEYVFSLLHPDFCIIGDGENAIVPLANTLERGEAHFDKIPNIGYWSNEMAVFTERKQDHTDINSYPFPDYEPFGIDNMLENHSLVTRYQYRYTRSHPIPMTLVAARGCPFNCSFCVHSDGARYRFRSIQNIMDEIGVMYERYHFNILIILDELFAAHKDRLQQFSLALLEGREKLGWDFDWIFQTHASANLDFTTLQLAKKAGCFFFSYGIESTSPAVLTSMNKRTDPRQIENAILLANKIKIGFGGNFIFGDPVETFQTARESLEFYKKHCLYIHVNIGTVQPYPGSKLFENCLARGVIRDKLDFYNNIDQIMYNMTSLTFDDWKKLLDEIMSVANQINYIPISETSSALHDIDAPVGERRGNGVKIPWKLAYSCPHCAESINTRELLADDDVATQKAGFVTGCPACHKRFIVRVIKK